MSGSDFKIIDQKIGVTGAVALTIGNAVAMTMFLLPAHLLAEGAGPSIALAALLTAIPTVFSILLMLQLGGAMPAAGGSYVYASRLIGPFWGFVVVWLSIPAVWLGLVYASYAVAEYIRFFLPLAFEFPLVAATVTVPEVSIQALIVACLLPFLVLNLFGIRMVTTVQFVLVGFIILGILVFVVPGSFQLDAANYTPMFPEGYGPFVVAMISLFIAMYGFGLAINIGEEIENPVENIPKIIAISTVVGVTLMVAIVVVAVGALDWQAWAGSEAGIAVVAAEFLPWWGSAIVALTAIVGALTTINTIYVNFSRLVMRAARDEVIPKRLDHVSDRFDSPNAAILLIGVPALFIVPVAPSPVVMSTVLSLSLLLTIVFLSVAAYRLPKLFPQRYEHSIYKLPKPVLYVAVAGGVIVPAAFWLLFTLQRPAIGLSLLGWIVVGYPVYRYRVRRYASRDVDLEEKMRLLHDHEQHQPTDFD